MEIDQPRLGGPEPERRSSRLGRLARRFGATATSLAVGFGGFVVWDAWDTAVNEPYVGPTVKTVDISPDHQPTMPCAEAESVLVTGSSMGLQVSEYMGRNISKLANQHDICILAVEVGTYYDDSMPDQIAQDLVDKVREEMPGREKIRMIFWGESWGGNMLQRVANSQNLKQADDVEVAKLILESTPSGMESVKWPGANILLEANKHGLWPGRYTLLLLGVGGAAYQHAGRADMQETLSKHIDYTRENNQKTSPRLTGQQGADIAINGFPRAVEGTDNQIPTVFVAWRGDEVVDNQVAIEEIGSRLGVPLEVIWISASPDLPIKHAECWKVERFRYCEPVLGPVIMEFAAGP